mgnify:CR=1 FL=1
MYLYFKKKKKMFLFKNNNLIFKNKMLNKYKIIFDNVFILNKKKYINFFFLFKKINYSFFYKSNFLLKNRILICKTFIIIIFF